MLLERQILKYTNKKGQNTIQNNMFNNKVNHFLKIKITLNLKLKNTEYQ